MAAGRPCEFTKKVERTVAECNTLIDRSTHHLTNKPMTEWFDVLNAREGMVCFVGAGGKKTTMYRIAESHPGRVAITATAHIEYFPRRYRDVSVVAEDRALYERIMALGSSRTVAFAKSSAMPGRHAGLSEEELVQVWEDGRFDVCLVKADGARGRLVKAPAEHEPPVPRFATTIVPIVSARVIGMPLSEKIAHRPERLAVVMNLAAGETITPHHIARWLASEAGALKRVGDAVVVPEINMVDDAEREALARIAAEEALELSYRFDRVVLTAMRSERPLVAVVNR
jgi:probable selenium-dependent hydroxylase accessory protein YqeC